MVGREGCLEGNADTAVCACVCIPFHSRRRIYNYAQISNTVTESSIHIIIFNFEDDELTE